MMFGVFRAFRAQSRPSCFLLSACSFWTLKQLFFKNEPLVPLRTARLGVVLLLLLVVVLVVPSLSQPLGAGPSQTSSTSGGGVPQEPSALRGQPTSVQFRSAQ
jgi:hypothetical protein